MTKKHNDYFKERKGKPSERRNSNFVNMMQYAISVPFIFYRMARLQEVQKLQISRSQTARTYLDPKFSPIYCLFRRMVVLSHLILDDIVCSNYNEILFFFIKTSSFQLVKFFTGQKTFTDKIYTWLMGESY